METSAELLFDAFGCGGGACLEGVGGEDMAFRGFPVAVREKRVRNDASQLGPKGERGEAKGVAVRWRRHGCVMFLGD